MAVAHQATDLSDEILDAVAAAILAVDREGNIVRFDAPATRLTGISMASSVRGDLAATAIFPADIDRWRAEIAPGFAGLPRRCSEIRWNCRSGSARILKCSFAPVRSRKAGDSESRDSDREMECVACTAIPCNSNETLADRAAELRDIERFLHDTLAQDLAALSCALTPIGPMSRGVACSDQACGNATGVLEMAGRCCRDVRIMSAVLRAPVIAGRTIECAMEQIARHLREDSGLVVLLDIDPVSDLLPDEARILLLTAFQQWCAWGARGMPSPEMKVRLRERRPGIVMELESAAALHTGRSLIRERALSLGGEFDIAQEASRGEVAMRMRLALPIAGGAL